MAEPKWKRFEKQIHQIHSQLAPEGAIVTLDDKIIGSESKTERQIDISIRASVAQYRILIVIECKDEARPIDLGTMGEFASLLRDVKANKGVIVSSSGYTPAAVEMARAQGIDARTYVDTESIDWRSAISIPAMLRRTRIVAWGVRSYRVPGLPWVVPANDGLPFIETFAEDGAPLGPMITLLGRKWNHDRTLHKPGEHVVQLAEHVLFRQGGFDSHARLEAVIRVERTCYFGTLPIHTVGFRDEHEGFLSTNELTTDFIDTVRIERGEMPGWRRVLDGEIALTATMTLGYIDALPETPSDVKHGSVR